MEPDYGYIAEIVKRAQTGNSDAFAELYLATYKKQYQFACRYLHDPDMAQDALQETYILVLKRLNSLKDPKLFISWLNQISFRVCFRMQQQSHRDKEISDDSLAEVVDTSEDPESKVIRIDQNDYIARQLLSLPSSEAQVLILHYYNNMKIEEIASLMGISRSTVIRYMGNGKNKLKKLLK